MNVYVWSGKWPQKMIAFDHTLRMMLAVKSAQNVRRNASMAISDAVGGAGVRRSRPGSLSASFFERGRRDSTSLRTPSSTAVVAPALSAGKAM